MKYLTSIWTTIILSLILITIRLIDPSPVQQLRLNTFDQYISTIPEKKSDIVLLNIGEESLGLLGQYPFPRQTYA